MKNAALGILGILGGAALLLLVGGIVWMQATLWQRIESAWLVTDGEHVWIAVRETSSGEDHDYHQLYVFEAATGARVARVQLGTSRSKRVPQLLGPSRRAYAWWHTESDGLRLLDLRTGEIAADRDAVARAVGEPFELAVTGGVDPHGRVALRMGDGRLAQLGSDLVVDSPFERTPAADAACQRVLTEARRRKWIDPTLRGCWDGRAFVQHAASAVGERRWRGTLFDGDANELWTVDAVELTSAEGAWFSDAMGLADVVWLAVPGEGTMHAIEVDGATGGTRRLTAF